MSVISWNCRGLGNPNAVLNLKYLIRTYKPDVILLYETLVNSNKIEEVRHMLGYDFCFAVDHEGRGGGVAMLWREPLKCTITNFSLNHIDIDVSDAVRGNWRLTGFYGYPEGSRRRDSWNLLRRLSQTSHLPWCIIGDFNDILFSHEKKGRADRQNWLINGFREAVVESGLIDMQMEGYQYTWFKSLGTDRAVEEKLDRALVCDAWYQLFPNARLQCLTATSSDHYPLLLVCEPVKISGRSNMQFKFENAWLVEPEFDSYVRRCWQVSHENNIVNKLDKCAADMSKWSKENFQNLRKEIEQCRKKLERTRCQVDASNIKYFNALKKRLTSLLVKDDWFWRQRAKTFWYQDGDLNTRFFHAAATSRRKVNRINSLEDVNGTVCNSTDDINIIARNYFVELFQKQNSSRDMVLNVITPSTTNDDNATLTAPFVIDEFKESTFAMQADKCPGPDGFNPSFYQHFWDVCGHEIYEAGCNWLESGTFPPRLNTTNIALIPKGETQTSMKDWRPIALCNVLYKIVAKVLANRLKGVLDKWASLKINQLLFLEDPYWTTQWRPLK